MTNFAPFAFLISILALFGILWIVFDVNPDNAPWYFFVLIICLIFVFIQFFLGTLFYLLQIRFNNRYYKNLQFKNAYKVSFFLALLTAILAMMAILDIISPLNIALMILAVTFFAIWNYLGKRKTHRNNTQESKITEQEE